MKALFREHGLLLSAVALSLVITFVYRAYSADVLDYGLDVIGERFEGLVQGPGEEAQARALFKAFKQRVKDRQIPPEQVEQITASILNMSHAGATLSPDQAKELFKRIEHEAARQDHAVAKASLEALGKDLKAVLAFDDALVAACDEDEAKRKKIWKQMRYDTQGGFKIKVDPNLSEELAQQTYAQVQSALKQMEVARKVTWEQNLAESMQMHQRHTQDALHRVAEMKGRKMEKQHLQMENLDRLEALRHLEISGVGPMFNADSLEAVIEAAMTAAQVEMETAMEEARVEIEAAQRETKRTRATVRSNKK